MASYAHQQQHMAPRSAQRQPASGAQQRPPHAPSAPAGTFPPGTKIQVGSHRVVIQKYLSEGGFAIVYLVKMPQPVDGTDLAVLKRVAVPDKDSLRNMRTEVETMKRLKGHHPIVTYIDSHASELRGGGYEVFLLMEYCNGGGLIDFMNTRLQHRLTEPEILSIFADIAEGVACMHYLKPPLLHRDIKVENVLITTRGSSKRFKLCDFGSAAPPRPAPTTVVECRLMDEDVQKHTTLQYRSPEMIDVYRKQPLNEKADIWALGVLLYKLCYYTTPFEEQGQLAILNASFRYPDYPVFSDRIKKLIASMLRESIEARPNIYQVLKEACSMQGRQIPIKDIYSGRPQTADRNSKVPADPKPQPKVGAVYSAPVREKKQQIPEVAPMRRGRPAPSQAASDTHSSPPKKKVTEGDPFTALDSRDGSRLEPDELSSRFPTLDQFSLLHDKGTKFDFDSTVSPPTEAHVSVAERRAAAEASTSSQKTLAVSDRAAGSVRSRSEQPRGSVNANYVSTGTMTTQESVESLSRRADQGIRQADSGAPRSQSHSTHLRRPSPSPRPALDEARPVAPKRPRPQSSLLDSSSAVFVRERESPQARTGSGRPLSRGSQLKPSSSPRPTARIESKTQNSAASDLIDINGADSQPVEKSDAHRSVNATPPSASRKKIGGKFEDTFKRFEGNSRPDSAPVRNDDDDDDDDMNDEQATPEMRREMERRQLEEEEQRVAAAQAEYKKRLAGEGNPGPRKGGVVARSAAIQNRVQSLLEEEQRPSQVQRTVEGYGKYTDAAKSTKDKALHVLPDGLKSRANAELPSTSTPSGALAAKPTGSKPAAPKKPIHLNKTHSEARPPSPAKRSQPEVLMATDLPGQPVLDMSAKEKEDYVEDFAKRFPSLNTVELEAMAAAQRR
ncbi:serine/threonine protein kinase [Ophiocordyceps camponoti-floridani]|uniref:non-specific serine/threonine protein kinase n=1 Tax=Ophiocordyceps camponoti-floridani TaxID=2030778 RepID=A0A8H4VEI2_9HYPO|nr:serine/threonine protein kinase [Ophiocordyceps camponoti-floridani]